VARKDTLVARHLQRRPAPRHRLCRKSTPSTSSRASSSRSSAESRWSWTGRWRSGSSRPTARPPRVATKVCPGTQRKADTARRWVCESLPGCSSVPRAGPAGAPNEGL